MTTLSWSTVVDHTSDAGFRAWGLELNTKFAACGLVQTADTGQINWATVTRPGVSTVGGFETWHLPGSALFFKIEYGTDTLAAVPELFVTVGTGTNGSGTITGAATSTRASFVMNAVSITSTVTAYQSLLCVTAASLGLVWKFGSNSITTPTPRGFMVAGLSVDASGAPSSVGFYILTQPHGSNSPVANFQTVRLAATAAARAVHTNFCLFTGAPTASSDGTNNQAYLHWMDTPSDIPCLYSASVIQTELVPGATASMTLVGSTPHTYISVGGAGSASPFFRVDAGASGLLCAVMLWE